MDNEKIRLSDGLYDPVLEKIYGADSVEDQRKRYVSLIDGYKKIFGSGDARLFSAPGRTEIGGNHTDHQNGRVLAAAVNVDTIACAAKNDEGVFRVYSEGYPKVEVSISDLNPDPSEANSTAALLRGIACAVSERGYGIGGFNAFVTSQVLSGSGLSSSAAFEVLIGNILNTFFCGGRLDDVEIAKIGQFAESVFFKKPCGLMDQMVSSVGNLVSIDFKNPKSPVTEQIDFRLEDFGHVLCIIDTGADHADLTCDYASIPSEMKTVAGFFGRDVLREVSEEDFYSSIPSMRKMMSDRAVLRAAHFFAENRRAMLEAKALKINDFENFLRLVNESGRSSYMYLQNVYSSEAPQKQAVSLALMTAERILGGKGAFRVHGGGFAGTIQAFVPKEMKDEFRDAMEKTLGESACHFLKIRPAGGIALT